MRQLICAFWGLLAALAFAGNLTYYAAPNGASDSDCLGPETAGNFANVMSKVTAVPQNSNVEVIFADGDYDCMTYQHETGYCWHPQSGKCSFVFRSASGDREKCRLIGGGEEGEVRGFAYLHQSKQILSFSGLQFTNFYATAAVLNSDYSNSSHAHVVSFSNCVFRANGKSDSTVGGCFRCQVAGSFTVTDCVFENNVARSGGVVNGYTRAQFYGCDFKGNRALRSSSSTQSGCGGVSYGNCYYSKCTFTANFCTGSHENGGSGGVAYAKAASATFEDCVFSSNTNSVTSVVRGNKDGAGSVVLRRCLIKDGKGSMFNSVTCENCYLTQNEVIGTASVYKNSLFFDNRITGGAFEFISGASTIYNCSFISNYTHNVGGTDSWHNTVIGSGGSTIYDSLFLDNNGQYGLSGSDGKGASGTNRFYNCVYNGSCNSGTVLTECTFAEGGVPAMKFKPVGEHFFVPSSRSKLLIGQGWNAAQFTEEDRDLAGNPRIVKDSIDIGCYEWQGQMPGLMLLVY